MRDLGYGLFSVVMCRADVSESMHLEGIEPIDWNELFSLPKDYWVEDMKETRQFLNDQVSLFLCRRIMAHCFKVAGG